MKVNEKIRFFRNYHDKENSYLKDLITALMKKEKDE